MKASRHASVVRVSLLACGGVLALLLASGCASEGPTVCEQAAAHVSACLGSQVDAIDESFGVERCQSILAKPCPTERQTATERQGVDAVGGLAGGALCEYFGIDCGIRDGIDCGENDDGSAFCYRGENPDLVGGLVGGTLCQDFGIDCGEADGIDCGGPDEALCYHGEDGDSGGASEGDGGEESFAEVSDSASDEGSSDNEECVDCGSEAGGDEVSDEGGGDGGE